MVLKSQHLSASFSSNQKWTLCHRASRFTSPPPKRWRPVGGTAKFWRHRPTYLHAQARAVPVDEPSSEKLSHTKHVPSSIGQTPPWCRKSSNATWVSGTLPYPRFRRPGNEVYPRAQQSVEFKRICVCPGEMYLGPAAWLWASAVVVPDHQPRTNFRLAASTYLTHQHLTRRRCGPRKNAALCVPTVMCHRGTSAARCTLSHPPT